MFGHILFTFLVKSVQEFIECSFLSYPHLFFQTKLPTFPLCLLKLSQTDNSVAFIS
jgi:hypothetical protein